MGRTNGTAEGQHTTSHHGEAQHDSSAARVVAETTSIPQGALSPRTSRSSRLRRSKIEECVNGGLRLSTSSLPREGACPTDIENQCDARDSSLEQSSELFSSAPFQGRSSTRQSQAPSPATGTQQAESQNGISPQGSWDSNAEATGEVGEHQPGAFAVYQRAAGSRPGWARRSACSNVLPSATNARGNPQCSPTPTELGDSQEHHTILTPAGVSISLTPSSMHRSQSALSDVNASSHPPRDTSQHMGNNSTNHCTVATNDSTTHLDSSLNDDGSDILLAHVSSSRTGSSNSEHDKSIVKQRYRKSTVLIATVAVVIVLALALGLGLTLGHKSASESPDTTDDGSSAYYKLQLDFFKSKVANVTYDVHTLDDVTSPQYKALAWLATTAIVKANDGGQWNISDHRIQTMYALAVLYHSTSGASWVHQAHFLDPDIHECTWNTKVEQNGKKGVVKGVVCDDGMTNVEQLLLDSNSLDGTLPYELNVFEHVQLLNFSTNALKGPLQTEWNFPNLRYYNAGKNNLNSTIPDAIWSLPNLEQLWLDSNSLSGTLSDAIGEAAFLEILALSENHLTGEIPESISNLTSLVQLRLSNNKFKGTIPSVLGTLPSLSLLYLNANMFNGDFPWESFALESEVNATCTMRHLRLGYNSFSDTIPWDLLQTSLRWSCLQEFSIRSSGRSGARLPEIAEGVWGDLHTLDLGSNLMVGTLPDSIGLLTALTWLNLGTNSFTGTIPSTLQNLENLKFLSLDLNGLTGSIPASLGNLSDLKHLELSNNAFQGTLPTSLAQINVLEVLNVRGNSLTGTLPTEFAQANHLTYLDISYNSLSGTLEFLCTVDHPIDNLFADCFKNLQCSCCTQCLR